MVVTAVVTKIATMTGENGVAVAVAIVTRIPTVAETVTTRMRTIAETVTRTMLGANDLTTGVIVIPNQSASWMSESVRQTTTDTTKEDNTRPSIIMSSIITSTSATSSNRIKTTISSTRTTTLTTRAKERNLALDCRDRLLLHQEHHHLYEFNPAIWVPIKSCSGKSEKNGMPSVDG
jgi:hypothetical protein